MGFNSRIKTLVQKAIKTTGDLSVKITYVRRVPGAYNSATGLTLDVLTSYPNVPAILTRPTEDDADWAPVNLTTKKILIAYQDLPIAVNDSDYVIIEGVTWNLHKNRGVPGGSLHILFVRNP